MSAHKVCLLYDRKGWAYWRRSMALQKYSPADFTVSLACGSVAPLVVPPADLYLQPSYNCTQRLRHYVRLNRWKSRIVTNFTTGWTREGPHEGKHHWDKFYRDADWIVFNNRAAWGLAGMPARSNWISNGVDRDMYRVTVPPDDRQPRVLWCGSTYHTKKDKHDLKNYYTLLEPLRQRLEARGIPCDYRRIDAATYGKHGAEWYTTDQMVEWYNTGTVYLCASDSEGTPNPALEAASCGCVLVSTAVGNMPELIQHGVNGLLVERAIDEMEAAVVGAVERYRDWQPYIEAAIASWHWAHRAQQYFDLFRKLLAVAPCDR